MNVFKNQRSQKQDGVHRWLVLISSYAMMVLDFGLLYSLGSLFVDIMEEFGTTRAQAAVIQSTAFGVALCVGVASGLMVKRFGSHIAGLAGSVLVTLGLMTSYFATSVTFLIISLGIIMGLGESLVFISCQTATEKRFDGRLKLIAMSLLATGSAIGGMIYPYLFLSFKNMFNLQWTFLLFGAISANCIPCCILLKSDEIKSKANTGSDRGQRNSVTNYPDLAEANASENDITNASASENVSQMEYGDTGYDQDRVNSVTNYQDLATSNSSSENDITKPSASGNASKMECVDTENDRDRGNNVTNYQDISKEEASENVSQMDTYRHNSSARVNTLDTCPPKQPVNSSTLSIDDFSELGKTKYIMEVRPNNALDGTREFTELESPENNTAVAVSAIDSFKYLLRNKSFIAYAFALAISYPIVNIFLIFIADVFADKGFREEDVSLGLTVLNVCSICGRISPGFIMQIPGFPTIGVAVIATFLGILSMIGVVLVPTLAASLVMCGVIGVSLGVFICMYTVGALRLWGREHLPTAIGIFFTSSGVVNASAGPISGLIRDRTNSYKIPFYSAAGCLVISCILFLVTHVTHKTTTSPPKRISVFHITKL